MVGTMLAVGAVLVTGIFTVGVIWQAALFLILARPPLDRHCALVGKEDGLSASFAGTRGIFFRRYLLAPGPKFCVVLLLLSMKSSIVFLAYGYVVAGVVGVLI